VPGFDLLGGEVRAGQDERRGEVVPVGLAGEIGGLEVVPGRLAGGPRERGCGVEALVDEHAVGGLDRLPVRLPSGIPACPRERRYYDSLVAGLALQHDVIEQAWLALHRPDRAGDRGRRPESGDLPPALRAAVGVHRKLQQVI
jgi:hypothetical protein